MTYKLEPWIEKIQAAIAVILPDGTQKRYISGSVAVADIFDRHYVVSSMSAVGSEIVIWLAEIEISALDLIWEEQQGFF